MTDNPLFDSSHNPYEYPRKDVEIIKVSGGVRFINYLIDNLVLYLIIFALLAVLFISLGVLAAEKLETIDEESSAFTLASYLTWFTVMIGYYTFMESVFGTTIGKLITGTKVVTRDGKTPSTKTIFLRTLSRLVPFEAFSFLGEDSRGWHDEWTDTWVVKKSK